MVRSMHGAAAVLRLSVSNAHAAGRQYSCTSASAAGLLTVHHAPSHVQEDAAVGPRHAGLWRGQLPILGSAGAGSCQPQRVACSEPVVLLPVVCVYVPFADAVSRSGSAMHPSPCSLGGVPFPLQYLPLGDTAVLTFLTPVFVAAAAPVVLKERAGKGVALAMPLCVAGKAGWGVERGSSCGTDLASAMLCLKLREV